MNATQIVMILEAADFTDNSDFHVLGLYLVNPPNPLLQGGCDPARFVIPTEAKRHGGISREVSPGRTFLYGKRMRLK